MRDLYSLLHIVFHLFEHALLNGPVVLVEELNLETVKVLRFYLQWILVKELTEFAAEHLFKNVAVVFCKYLTSFLRVTLVTCMRSELSIDLIKPLLVLLSN